MGMTGPLSQKNLLAHPVLPFHCWKPNLGVPNRANGFRSFGYLQISFAFFLIILGPLPAASDAIPLFFPGCLIVGGGGRGGAALRGRGWRCGGGAGRTGIGQDGAIGMDWYEKR